MDATFVVSASNWILAELVRVFHKLSIEQAQQLVDAIAERRVPLIWQGGDIKRVLNPKIEVRDQILLLVATSPAKVIVKDLRSWTEYKNTTRFTDLLKSLHGARLLEFDERNSTVEILPPGSLEASQIAERYGPRF
jgi:hypothetical protein